MKPWAFLPFLVLLLGFSSLFSSSIAVPASRSLEAIKQEPSAQDLRVQDVMELGSDGEMLAEEGFIEGRMAMESTDYPGTGANNHHDPKTPGRV